MSEQNPTAAEIAATLYESPTIPLSANSAEVQSGYPPAVIGCRFEGEFLGQAYAYTDMEQGSPAYGGTFAVPIREATPAAALAARDRQRLSFLQGKQEVAA